MTDIFAELEKKPETGGPYWKYKSDNGIRWSSMESVWSGEPWSFAKRRLALLKNPKKRTKAKPIEGKGQGCLHAGIASNVLPMRSLLAVGFGGVEVNAGGVYIWSGDEPRWTVARVEKLAATKPRLEWLIVYNGPLSGKTYKRAGVEKWVLIEQNQGFA